MRKTTLFLIAFAAAVATLTSRRSAQRGGTAVAPPADLVLTNGRIVTVDDGAARGRGDRDQQGPHPGARVGGRDQGDDRAATQVIDLQGQLAIPGIHREPRPLSRCRRRAAAAEPDERRVVGQGRRDGRGSGVARAPGRVDLRPRLAPGEVDVAPGACTSKGSRPTRRSTRCRRTTRCCSCTPAATPRSPTRKAMELSGIRRPTESPAGGEILRDKNGDATGLLRETRAAADQARRRRAAADAGRNARRATGRRSNWRPRKCWPRASPRSRTPGRTSRPSIA